MVYTYAIHNTASGLCLGAYVACTLDDALDVMAHEAGYEDHDAACVVAPVEPGELVVRELAHGKSCCTEHAGRCAAG